MLHKQLCNGFHQHYATDCFCLCCHERPSRCPVMFRDRLHKILAVLTKRTKLRHRRKIKNLLAGQQQHKPKHIANNVVNLSSVEFTNDELELLNRGLKFAIRPAKAPVPEIIANV